ncbi:MAG: SseB family protein [Actinobacteria bacterium]|nr:SseB family protein [Actinomycetota bacterium]
MAIKKLPSTGDVPRTTGVPESLVPGGSADSAGFPWQGRSFDHHGTAFADDDGRTPAALIHAVDAIRAAARVASTGEGPTALAAAHAETVAVLSGCRLLIPLLAEAGDLGATPDGRTVEKTQELSIVTVAGPDGRKVMPAFSSVETMRAWNPEARPIPVPAPQAALAAAQEQTDLIIIDPGTPEREFGVRRTQLEAMALGTPTLPAWADPEVGQAFRASIDGESQILAIELAAGDPEARLLAPETDVILSVAAGLDRQALQQIVAGLQQRWAANRIIAERVDSLRVALRAG